MEGAKVRETVRLRCEQPEMIRAGVAQQLAKQELRQEVNRDQRRRQLLRVFRTVDVSHDGFISASELGTLLSTLGHDLTAAELRDRMREVDVDDSGGLDFDEFAQTLERWQAEELEDVFAHFDGDGSGTISVAELSIAIQSLGEESVPPEEADARAARVDSDGSGLIDREEFCAYMSPMMAITHVHQFSPRRVQDGVEVKMVIDDLGVELTADVKVKEASVQNDESSGPADTAANGELHAMLGSLPLLGHLDRSELAAVAGAVTEQEFAAGTAIITQGEIGDVMFFLEVGTAVAVLESVGVVKNYSRGDYFGELALLRDQPRTASVFAGSKGSRCWALDRDTFNTYANLSILEDGAIAYNHSYHSLADLQSTEVTEVGFALTFKFRNRSVRHGYTCAPQEARKAVNDLKQHQAKLLLRRDIQRRKQKELLREAFNTVDVSNDGAIDMEELGLLLSTLGESLTGAELRARARDLDADGSGTLEFDEFADMMVKWQEEELRDVFSFFDDDASGSISVSELSAAIQALGENGVTSDEADARAARVDSDGSGLIDVDEFCVYMKPLMSITQRHEFAVTREADQDRVKLVISVLGVQLTDSRDTVAYSFFKLVRTEESSNGITLTIMHRKAEIKLAFATNDAAIIVATLSQHQAKLVLRRDIQKHKQMLKLRAVFSLVDTDRTGCIDVFELQPLLQTLGHDLRPAAIDVKIKEMDLDNTGDISFEEFVSWMEERQETELVELFKYFDRNNSGTISTVELAQMLRSMGEQMTQAQVKTLAEQVDSDNSGEIDCDEFCVLLRPMLSLTDRATFHILQEDKQQVDLTVSGLGIEVTRDGISTLYSFAKVADFESWEPSQSQSAGFSVAVKNLDGNLSMLFFETA